MVSFLEKYRKARDEKRSVMSVGLDAAAPSLRGENAIPDSMMEGKEETDAKLDFCLDLVEKVSDYACAAKPNNQYIIGFSRAQHMKLNKAVRNAGMVSILDHKLSDIGASNQSGMLTISEVGYDAITFSPFAGNIDETMKFGRQYNLGIICLTLMSNPDAVMFMKEAQINGKPGYVAIAEKVKEFSVDGVVVGTTGHVTLDEIMQIRSIIGDDKLMFFPGIGAQGGDAEKVMKAGGENIMVHVGRAIMYSDNPGKKAKEYNDIFNSMRKRA